jgi:hypothetical protein
MCTTRAVCPSVCSFRHPDATFRNSFNLFFSFYHPGSYGSSLDADTSDIQRKILQWEQPQLVVFSGDVITGKAGNASRNWQKAVAVVNEKRVPYATM